LQVEDLSDNVFDISYSPALLPLVNGSSARIVRVELEPGVRAWVMGAPVRLTTLRISLNTPDELMSLLRRSR